MSDVQNSLSSFVQQLLIEHNNSVEIWKRLTDALNSNKESVTVNIDGGDGNVNKIQIPSFGWLKAQIERLDNNVQSLSGLNNSSAVSQLEDGSFQQIVLNTLDREAPNITSLSLPTSFDFKNNWFFENFLNPLLYVNFNLTGQIDSKTEKALVRRYILNITTDDELDYFNINYNGRNDVDIDLLEEDLLSQGIQYFTDEEVREIPFQENIFYGDFDVIKIFDDTIDEIANITSETKRRKRYKLNKLTYSSKNSTLMETETLKIGDNLIVNTGRRNSRYKVINIETGTSIVELDIIEGYDSINIGSGSLSFYNQRNSFINLEIPIGFNERIISFIRPIDPNSNIPSNFWSPGVAFFTNDLNLSISNGSSVTLSEFYSSQVIDFGQYLLGIAKDSTPPAVSGITPDSPQLNSNDFKVIEVNQHLTQRKVFDDIRKLQNEKNKLNSEIEEIDIAVVEKREELATTKFTSNIDRSKIVTELQNFERDKQNRLKLLGTIIDRITNLSSESSLGINSKYRIRGFWPFPDSKLAVDGTEQEVIQFIIEYRYLSKDGDSNSPQQIEFTDNNGNTQIGAQSTWIRLITDVRPRGLDETTGQYVWQDEDVQNADSVNINQLDIPIQSEEKVQIRMISVSEAGYPTNPLKSEYSNVIEIEFPDDLSGTNSVDEIVDEAKNEQIRVEIDNDLAAKGLNIHLSDSFTANEKYFAHTATSIDSGFLSPEQKPVALADKLIELENSISQINATLSEATPELTALLIDEEGNSLPILSDQINQIFAGYYRDIVSNLSVKKGVVVNRTFFLTLRNNSQTSLKFRSNEPGSITNNFQQFNSNQPFELYNEVPILLNSNSPINQSSQVYGQFIYFRKGGIDTNLFYKSDNTSTSLNEYTYSATVLPKSITPTGFVAVNSNGLIGAGDINLTNTGPGSELENPIYIHVDHPSINIDDQIPDSNTLVDNFGNSRLAPVIAGSNLGIFNTNQSETILNTEFRTQWEFKENLNVKQSFKAEDQYLIGPGSCGAYLFPLIRNINEVRVNGDTINANREILPGEEFVIPLVFQFRMTDYFGEGETGLGNVGGDYTQATENLSYTKAIGFDLYTTDNRKFSFDIEMNALYKSEGATLKNIQGQRFDSTNNTQDIIL